MSKLKIFVALIFGFYCHSAFAQQILRLDIIDVGEGDSILIRSPEGQAALIDTGNPITGPVIVNYLKQQKVASLDFILLTHPHFDHIGGVFSVAQSISTGGILDNGQDISKEIATDNNYRWYDEFVRKRQNYGLLRRGDERKLGSSTLRVLWPPQGKLDQDWNNNSLVLMVTFGEFRALLMGDAMAATEDALIKSTHSLHANILKAGHHASSGTATAGFLESVAPEAVVISINPGNANKYPDEKVVERYAHKGRVYRTDQQGSVTVTATSDGKFTVLTEKAS